jgi:Ger(x)C family germination protein
MKSDKITQICPINRGKAAVLLFLLVFALFFTSGCWNQIEVVDTAEAEGLVLDLEGGQSSFSVQLAKPSSSQAGTQPSKPVNITQTGSTYTESARKVMLSLPRLPLWAHAGVIIIGQDLAHADLAQAADFMARNRNVRKTSSLFISKGVSGKECLEASLPIETYSIAGLKKLIRIQEEQLGFYMPVNLDVFLEKLATPGIQPAVPQVTIMEMDGQKMLRLDGTAVFKGRQVVGSLDEVESQGYRFLSPKMITGGLITIHKPGDNSPDSNKLIAIELTRSQAHINPQIKDGKIKKMQIKVEAEGNFHEQNFVGQILTLDDVKKIEELTNEEIKKKMTAAIMKTQGLNSDIFGWGRIIAQKNPALWQSLEADWPVIFAGIEADISVDFSLRRTYLLDKSFEFKE